MSHNDLEERPITLIGGYLGAGKTTLINRLLNSGRLPSNTAVLVNDFGDINIDEHLIRRGSKADNVIGLANGCICCSISDDLSSALEQLRATAVQRIILECSGVAEPAKARQQCLYPGFYPHAMVVLVDAAAHEKRCTDKYVGALARAQVQQADLLVVSKSALNPDFRLGGLLPCVDGEDPGLLDMLLGWQADAGESTQMNVDSAPQFVAKTFALAEKVSLQRTQVYLRDLPVSVQRVKGFLITDQGIVEVHRVGTQLQIHSRPELNAKPPIFGLVFIGYNGAELPQYPPAL
jgi:Ni2+-binding GTPase involved in maturation of urease and hydrogenase